MPAKLNDKIIEFIISLSFFHFIILLITHDEFEIIIIQKKLSLHHR